MTKRTRKPTANPYSVHPGVAMVEEWAAALSEKTGRSFEAWLKHIRTDGPKDEKARREWLKRSYGLGTNTCWWLAEKATRSETIKEDSPEGYLAMAAEYVEAQYAGKKAALRPIYDRLLALGLSRGKDAKACPCKTMVPLYREHVFANITPTTNSRVDLGLALAKVPESKVPKRLIDTGGKAKKDRITHRIAIGSVDEIDGVVERWLKMAYQLDAAPKEASVKGARRR